MGRAFPTAAGTGGKLCRLSNLCPLNYYLVFLQLMYRGVLKDDERRREKRRQREEEFIASQHKREIYERVQKVEKSTDRPTV